MKRVTVIIIVVATVGLTLYDIAAVAIGGINATISSVIWQASYTEPYGAAIPLAFGLLVGHLFLGGKNVGS
jgi:hypothetical protein